MINIPKKQLYNPYYFLTSLLLLPLIGFFIYAGRYAPSFFFLIILSLMFITAFLFSRYSRLIKKQAITDLQRQNYLEKINLLNAEMNKEQQAIVSFRQKIVNYSQLKNLTERLSMQFTVQDTTKTLSSEINELFGQQDITVILYLFHAKTGELGLSYSQKEQKEIKLKAKQGDVFDQWTIRTMKPLLIEDARNDFRFDVDKIETEDNRTIRSLMSVPLMTENKALGILRVDSPQENSFSTEDIRLLTTVATLGAIAIENAQLYERVEDMAIRDSLTGLYLRRYLWDRLSHELSRQLRRNKELSFLMIDLDKFKEYNDTCGHRAGDIVLKTLGRILTDQFDEPGNFVCRYGGEEFSVLLPDCSKEQAVKAAETLRKKVAAEIIVLRREKTNITVSIGVASFPGDAQIKEELVHKADQALYRAKRKGRNRVVCAV